MKQTNKTSIVTSQVRVIKDQLSGKSDVPGNLQLVGQICSLIIVNYIGERHGVCYYYIYNFIHHQMIEKTIIQNKQ